MYRQRKSNSGHNNHRNNFPNFNRGTKQGKRLSPDLFIKKASSLTVEADSSVTSSFADYPIIDKIKRNISEHGYTIPTPIQAKAIPEILAGRDIIGIADTGTGKTAAFLITLINKCYLDRNQRTLIVVPTRELAIQIVNEYKIFAKGTNLEVVATIGGSSMRRQLYALRYKPHFVIGTPGRIKDLVKRRELDMTQFQNIVLDEVDRMVDIGFFKDIQFLISLLPKVRQSLFFSATVNERTQQTLQLFVSNPVKVSVKHQNTASSVDQNIVKLTGSKAKIDVLHDLLIRPEFNKVIIFGRTKWGMEKLSHSLTERGFKAASIHSNKSQGQRQRVLEDFRQGTINILIATDIASRGIDINDISHVINYDQPATYDDYIHRIGRTGRAGKQGVALTFVE